MKPHKTVVLIKAFPSATISAGGILLPQNFNKRKNIGTIISVGEGTKNEPMLLKEGMVVYNIQGCGDGIDINGEPHFLVQQRDVLAIEEVA